MGKGLLIIVLAALTGTAMLVQGSQRTAFESDFETSKYEGEVIVREIARSAINKAIGEARRDFAQAENVEYAGVAYQSGSYDVTSERISGSSVVLQATGHFGTFEYTIRSTLTQTTPFNAVINIDTEDVDATYDGNSLTVDGRDTNPPSAPGGSASVENDKHAIHALTNDGREAAFDALALNQHDNVRGVDGDADIVSGAFGIDFETLYNEAKAEATMVLTDGRINGNTTFGTSYAPEIVYVSDDARINGTARGYGVLVVDGDLQVTGNMIWEGLIVVRDDTGITADFGGNSSIYGAVVLLGRGAGVETAYSIRGNTSIQYSSEALSRFNTSLSTLSSASKIVISDQWQNAAY